MSEQLLDIVKSIDSCDNARKGAGITAVARIHCLCDGSDETYWFTNRYYSLLDSPELKAYGHFVPKNSLIAVKMQTFDVGTSFVYDQPDYIKRIINHSVFLENRSIFQNHTIAIAGDPLTYQYRNIKEFLEALRQNQEDIRDIENKITELRLLIEDLKLQDNTSHQRGQISKSINELQREYRILTQQQEDLKNITVYIRKQGEMRYSLIVDTIQTRIKSQNLFDGKTVIINGGPGTGKSTTMIHRLAYLTDTFALDEDEEKGTHRFKLNPLRRRRLREAIESQRDWIFFSPSQLLKEYLADAMKKEGLTNTYQKVWNWKDYCRMVLDVNYHLMGDDTSKRPFRNCYLGDTLFYQGFDIITEFTDFYLCLFRGIKDKLPSLSDTDTVYAWTAIAKGIEKRFEGSESFDLKRFITLFNSLESVYGNDCKNLLRDRNEAIRLLADEICCLLDKHEHVKSDILDLFDLTDDMATDAEGENGNSEEANENQTDERGKLHDKIESWLKPFCYSQTGKDVQFSDEEQLICESLLPLLKEDFKAPIQKIGELMVFEQFAQYTRGVKAIMLNGLPARYKKFRSHLIKTKYEGCNLRLLRDIMQLKQGKELHFQEQSLLLGFINSFLKQIKASSNVRVKHEYMDAYEEISRPIVGIDEATDFSACDIYAMQSLVTSDFGSLTLCGDMMQRLTSYGITSWDELNGIVPNPEVVEMKTSYRQSKKLLDVAGSLFRDTLGETPNYKAFMKSNKVPAPLAFVDENETSKIDWISKRICEIYRAYGEQLPSIAIFVNDRGYIPNFNERLQASDFFIQNGIKVLDGLENTSSVKEKHICVYPIDVVKGMEFDVVFFHNIDNSSVDTERLKRYIYVGVSRAAFFLGITLSEKNDEITKYFVMNKDWFRI